MPELVHESLHRFDRHVGEGVAIYAHHVLYDEAMQEPRVLP